MIRKMIDQWLWVNPIIRFGAYALVGVAVGTALKVWL